MNWNFSATFYQELNPWKLLPTFVTLAFQIINCLTNLWLIKGRGRKTILLNYKTKLLWFLHKFLTRLNKKISDPKKVRMLWTIMIYFGPDTISFKKPLTACLLFLSMAPIKIFMGWRKRVSEGVMYEWNVGREREGNR